MKGKRLGLMAAGDCDGDSVREGMFQALCGGDFTGVTCVLIGGIVPLAFS